MTDQAGNTVKMRRCRTCGDTDMMPDSRVFTGMETTITYHCSECGTTAEIKSLGQAGLIAAVSLIVFIIVSFITVEGHMPWDGWDYILYAGFIILTIFPAASILYPHWRYPVTGEKKTINTVIDFEEGELAEDYTDPLQKSIIRFEKFGFLTGFLAPIVFIAAILGMATIIGMINFYYF